MQWRETGDKDRRARRRRASESTYNRNIIKDTKVELTEPRNVGYYFRLFLHKSSYYPAYAYAGVVAGVLLSVGYSAVYMPQRATISRLEAQVSGLEAQVQVMKAENIALKRDYCEIARAYNKLLPNGAGRNADSPCD
jgi:hypothetical protein